MDKPNKSQLEQRILFLIVAVAATVHPPAVYGDKDVVSDEDGSKKLNDGNTSMKLGRQDMSLFGFCPSRDEFSLVVCEKCNLLVKPQALKQHIESRHGPTNLSSLGSITASALNSELGKKLLMPLPLKSSSFSSAASSEKRTSEPFKPMPTKPALKPVPVSLKNNTTPILSGGVKISITKPAKSGNRLTPAKAATSVMSNPIVKVEKLERISISSSLSSSASKPEAKQEEPEPPLSELSKNILNIDSTKISPLLNGSIKSAVALTPPPPSSLTIPFSSLAVSASVVKSSTDTLVNQHSVVTFVKAASLTKLQAAAPVMSSGANGSLAVHHVTDAKNVKLSKEQKERKFLPCKDREYDANKHCGVTVSETSKPCTRSLTCKTHALSLRRAVPGRSKSFDGLLKEHKAIKEAILKAKAKAHHATVSASSVTSAQKSSVSSMTASSSLTAGKQPMAPVIPVQIDGKLSNFVCGSEAISTMKSSSTAAMTAATFVKPHLGANVFQRLTPSVMCPTITVKEETTGSLQKPSSGLPSSSPLSSSSPEVSHMGSQDLKHDHHFVSHHPKPMSCNHFGGRLSDRNCFLFSRKMDYVRAALLSALQRQLNPPPHKKLCVESNLLKESQVLSSSQDPYEFNLVDTSGGASSSASPAVVSPSKAGLKPKSKLPASPVTSSPSSKPTFDLCLGAATAALPSSTSPISTICATPMEMPAASPPSNITLNWPIRSWDEATCHSSNASPSSAIQSAQMTNPCGRKRNGSSTSLNGQVVAVPGNNGALPGNPVASIAMALTTNATGVTGQQAGLIGVITPTNLASHQTGNLITIPSASLPNCSFGQQNTATLCTSKASSGGISKVTSHKNNIFKDFNLVLTGIDSSLVNGQQYVNITNAQLAELATLQGQTLFLNSLAPGELNNSSASGTIHSISRTGSQATARPVKRSRSSGSKPRPALVTSDRKMSASALDTYKLVPASSLQPATVLMDGGSLQEAMLALAAATGGSTTPTLVAIASSADSTNNAMVVASSPHVLCTDSPSTIKPSSFVNGISQSPRDNCGSISQHHQHSSSTKSQQQQQHQYHQSHQECNRTMQHYQDTFLSGVLQAAPPPVAMALPPAAASQLCANQTLLKPSGSLNVAAKSMAGQFSMQPVSLTFPVSVSQAGLAALASGKQQSLHPQLQQQPHHTLSIMADGVSTGDLDSSATVLGTRVADLHLQSQITGASTSSLLS